MIQCYSLHNHNNYPTNIVEVTCRVMNEGITNFSYKIHN